MHPNEAGLNEFVDGTLADAGRAEVEQHLQSCADCRATVHDLRELAGAARTPALREPPARVWTRLERAIRLESGPPSREDGFGSAAARLRASRYLWPALAAAAIVVVAFSLALRFARRAARPAGAPAETADSTAVRSAASGK